MNNEPKILSRGKKFYKRVQQDWKRETKGGKIKNESTIELIGASSKAKRKRYGRMDIFVDELGDYVSIVEIKSTDWDRIKKKNRRRLMGSHRRQVWKYIVEFTDQKKIDVCAGIIYPKHPESPGLKEEIEEYLNDYGLQVVWYDS